MKRLINDLLKSPSGKYSRKSFLTLITFIYVLGLGIYVTIYEKSTTVFDSTMLFLSVLVAGTIADKKIINKSVPNTTSEEES